jgi:oligopeptide transport system substrate-binding protein
MERRREDSRAPRNGQVRNPLQEQDLWPSHPLGKIPVMAATPTAIRLRQGLAGILLLGAFGLALALASGARLEPADFTFNNGTEVQTLDPATITGVPEGRVVRSVFEGLVVKHPKTLVPMPGMAESWTISEDGRTYVFKIRADALWSNGNPVTAHDFEWSWQRLLTPITGANYAEQLFYVEGAHEYYLSLANSETPDLEWSTVGIRALDDTTLHIQLKSPTAFFLDLCGFYPLFPVNRGNIEDAQRDFPSTWKLEWVRSDKIVTNGPYVVESRRVNDRIRLRKNELYWDADNVAFNTIDVLAIEKETTMFNLYHTGGCDMIDRVDSKVADILMKREDFNPAPYMGTYFYRVNVTEPPYNDVRVRRALNLTIPRKTIVEEIERMGQIPAYSLVPPVLADYTPIECDHENLEEALRLLAEAGFPKGQGLPPVEIHYNSSDAHKSIAEVIGDTWRRDLGITVKLRNEEWKVYLDTQNTLRYQLSRSAWIGDYVDAFTFLDMFVTGRGNNKTGWSNLEYDALVKAATEEADKTKRIEILQSAERILMDELPILPIYYYVDKNIVAPRLGGFEPNALDEHFPKHWYWMDDAELAAKRAQLPTGKELVDPHGPSAGQYSPAENRRRAAAKGNDE